MTYIYAFLFVGVLCLIAQIIIDNTCLSFGHITSLYVVLGTVLAFFDVYDKIKELAGAGASLPITSLGNLLYHAALDGYLANGVLGIFQNMLTTTSAGITAAIVFAFIMTLMFKPHD